MTPERQNAACAGRCAWVIGVIVLLRLIGLWLDRSDLYVDEAQYWLWGQDLAFGYYSKPPMIGWLLRAVTDLAGSDAAFWIRLPAIVLHGVTAALLAAITARHISARAAPWVAAAYLTMPLITVGSYMMSTDTVMFPFLTLALLAWLRLAEGGGRRWAILAGLALGGGVMSKYAAVYYLILILPAAALIPAVRVPGRRAALAAFAFCIAVAPNVIWNIANGLTTLRHTMDNADWVNDPAAKAALNLGGLMDFAGSQFVVFGPAFLAALLWLTVRPGTGLPLRGLALWLSLPIIALVCVQALLNQAYANWAAAAYLAATLAVVPWLLLRARWLLIASLALHGAFAVTVPVAAHLAPTLRLGAEAPLLMARWLGRQEMTRTITARAAELPVTAIVADDRDVLADLFYRARGKFPAGGQDTSQATGGAAALPIWAEPESGRAPNHYVQSFPYPAGRTTRVLLVTRSKQPPRGCAATPAGVIDPDDGAYARRTMRLFIVDSACWDGIAR